MNWKLIGQQGLLAFVVGASTVAYSNDNAPWWLKGVLVALIAMITRWMVDTAVKPYRTLIKRAHRWGNTDHKRWRESLNADERRVVKEMKVYLNEP